MHAYPSGTGTLIDGATAMTVRPLCKAKAAGSNARSQIISLPSTGKRALTELAASISRQELDRKRNSPKSGNRATRKLISALTWGPLPAIARFLRSAIPAGHPQRVPRFSSGDRKRTPSQWCRIPEGPHITISVRMDPSSVRMTLTRSAHVRRSSVKESPVRHSLISPPKASLRHSTTSARSLVTRQHLSPSGRRPPLRPEWKCPAHSSRSIFPPLRNHVPSDFA